jgi:hypothetical protein
VQFEVNGRARFLLSRVNLRGGKIFSGEKRSLTNPQQESGECFMAILSFLWHSLTLLRPSSLFAENLMK